MNSRRFSQDLIDRRDACHEDRISCLLMGRQMLKRVAAVNVVTQYDEY